MSKVTFLLAALLKSQQMLNKKAFVEVLVWYFKMPCDTEKNHLISNLYFS